MWHIALERYKQCITKYENSYNFKYAWIISYISKECPERKRLLCHIIVGHIKTKKRIDISSLELNSSFSVLNCFVYAKLGASMHQNDSYIKLFHC